MSAFLVDGPDLVAGVLAAGAVGALFTAAWTRGQRDRLRARLRSARYAATHDPLTGLYNRAGVEAAYEQLHAAAGPVLVALVDLDAFKAINDTLGHAAVDAVYESIFRAGRDAAARDVELAAQQLREQIETASRTTAGFGLLDAMNRAKGLEEAAQIAREGLSS